LFFTIYQAEAVNEAGCRLVTEVAKKYNCLVGLPLSTTRSYDAGEGKEKVQQEFQNQVDVFKDWEGDLLMAEVKLLFFLHPVKEI